MGSYANHAKRSGKTLTEQGTYINTANLLLQSHTPFSEKIVTSRNQQVILNANLPISDRRDRLTGTNGSVFADFKNLELW